MVDKIIKHHRHAFKFIGLFENFKTIEERLENGPFMYCEICKCIPSEFLGHEIITSEEYNK